MKNFVFCLILFLAFSCQKEIDSYIPGKTTPVSKTPELKKNKPGFVFGWSIEFKAGHPKSSCNGGDIWIPTEDYYGLAFRKVHFPCVGAGTSCTHTIHIGITLSCNPGDVSAQIPKGTLSGLMTFISPLNLPSDNLPVSSRSFPPSFTGLPWWTNIPEQEALKNDQDGNVFSLNMTFSDYAIYPVIDN
ncbi:MAG: hypothetical protein H8E98_08015 [Bacteroidetes bacterium]|nr:hypothetical protein [Bacteroidota bacterium]MBL6963695.1 hypothetical protein [Bacteroidota bacterium]